MGNEAALELHLHSDNERAFVGDPALDSRSAVMAEESIVEPRDRNGELQSNWNWILAVFRQSVDLAEDGATFVIQNPFAPHVNPIPYARSGVIRMLDTLLEHTVVQQTQPEQESQSHG